MGGIVDISRLRQTVGRYMLFGEVGAGGMGSVHLGRRVGPAGFSRLVAIKRLHPHLATEKDFVYAFLDEARIAARISHPNVVSIDDVVMAGDEVLLVMEYVHGRALSFVTVAERARGHAIPPSIAVMLTLDVLQGLQAAHDARDERGEPLGVIHRDISPHNILVGADGVARVLDFGIAKALGRLQSTNAGSIKGKLAYMAPERLTKGEVTSSVDVYGVALVLWEMLSGERYFTDVGNQEALIHQVANPTYRHLGDPALSALDAVLEQALQRDPAHRFASARELGTAIEAAFGTASRGEVTAWLEGVAGAELASSAEIIAQIEQWSTPSNPMSHPDDARPPLPVERTGALEEGVPSEAELPPVTDPEPPPAVRNPSEGKNWPSLSSTDGVVSEVPTTSPTKTAMMFGIAAIVIVLGFAAIIAARTPVSASASVVGAPIASTSGPLASPSSPASVSSTSHAAPDAVPAVPVPASAASTPPRRVPAPPVRGTATSKPAPIPAPTTATTTTTTAHPDDETPSDRK